MDRDSGTETRLAVSEKVRRGCVGGGAGGNRATRESDIFGYFNKRIEIGSSAHRSPA